MKRISLLHATHCQLESEFSWLWVQRYSRDSSGSPAALVVFGPSPVLTHGSSVSIHRTSTKDLVFGEESDLHQFSCFQVSISCRKTQLGTG